MQIIPKNKFTFAFEKLGWDNYVSEDGKYIVWTFNKNPEIWTLVPRDEKSREYLRYQEQNIELILYSLNLELSQENITKIYEQLLGFHYPIISRLTSKNTNFDSGIPLNLADTILNKIHSSFLDFRKTFNTEVVNNLRFGHTEQGSFILKILVPVTEDNEKTLFDDKNQTAFEIENYLNQVQELTKIETSDPKKYAEKINSNGISSGLVESFVGKNGIAEILQKHIENDGIDDLFLSSEHNNLLEFSKENDKKSRFSVVDLFPLKPVSESFIKAVKEVEKSYELELKNAEIVGTLYAVSQTGTAMFEIESINGKKEKLEKAQTTELTEERIKKCWQAGADRKKLKIRGDITRKIGKTAKIIIGDEFDFYETQVEKQDVIL